jgi:hypothetical protein
MRKCTTRAERDQWKSWAGEHRPAVAGSSFDIILRLLDDVNRLEARNRKLTEALRGIQRLAESVRRQRDDEAPVALAEISDRVSAVLREQEEQHGS